MGKKIDQLATDRNQAEAGDVTEKFNAHRSVCDQYLREELPRLLAVIPCANCPAWSQLSIDRLNFGVTTVFRKW
ncbi:MAG: hypothetical protein HQ518_28275 [Rhodopirellula sp.]|nr:hypothetical protein [Rhodopirellula sp.]